MEPRIHLSSLGTTFFLLIRQHTKILPHDIHPGVGIQPGLDVLLQWNGLRLLSRVSASLSTRLFGAGLRAHGSRVQRILGLLGLQGAKRFVEIRFQLRLFGLQRSDVVLEIPGVVKCTEGQRK